MLSFARMQIPSTFWWCAAWEYDLWGSNWKGVTIWMKGESFSWILKGEGSGFQQDECPPPHPPTAIIKIHPSKDTARPINLPRSHRYRPSSPKEITTRETGWRSGWAAERGVDAWQCNMGRNKLAEWKIRKRNLSHHCRLPLSYCK